jgi:hypothetical protein
MTSKRPGDEGKALEKKLLRAVLYLLRAMILPVTDWGVGSGLGISVKGTEARRLLAAEG